MFGMPGLPELIILAVIILLLFGKRLPGAMRALGQSVVEFKKGASDANSDPQEEETGSAMTSQR